jgi:mannose-6-phosphate isomerase-like protein (cupin superfamily)
MSEHEKPAGDEPRQPHRHIHLDEIERLPAPGTLTWLPVRETLGIQAFGTNAYVASAPGEDVVEPHTESAERNHQELYFVARGMACFTIDDDSFDAPAGTYVFVPDVRSHRHAVAQEAGTTVLSFGGPPTFSPSPWELAFRALAMRESDPIGARELLASAADAEPNDVMLHYNLACFLALEQDVAAAAAELEHAIGLDPSCAEWAADDEDFAAVREAPAIARLLG